MKKWIILIIGLVVLAGSLTAFISTRPKAINNTSKQHDGTVKTDDEQLTEKETRIMKIASKAFSDSETIPDSFTCKGANINPLLTISDVPDSAKSLVLIMDDPDAPSGTANPGWVHWVIFNIDPSTTEIAEDSVPAGGVLGMTDFGNARYGGPCPPSGTHHYHFSLFALDSLLGLSNGASKSDVEAAMANHVITKSDLIGLVSK